MKLSDPISAAPGLQRPHLAGCSQRALLAWSRAQGAPEGAARALARALVAQVAGRPGPAGERASAALLAAAVRDFETGLPRAEPTWDPDGTGRFAVHLADGAIVEAVAIHQPQGPQRTRARWTVCLSSQVGCARACSFCETGKLGLLRNLAPSEIVVQFALVARALAARGEAQPTNVVFMGMGEPLDNLESVLGAIEVLREPGGFAVPERRITISTVGIVPRMEEVGRRSRAALAVSLHALDPAVRARLLPVSQRWSLDELRAAIAAAPRTVLLQWTLIAGLNDGDEEADRLLAFARGLDVRVNLIPLNPGPDPSLAAPTLERCRAFQRRLADGGLRALLRLPHGQSVGGACGQLAGAARAAGQTSQGL